MAVSSPNEDGGYDFNFAEEVDDELVCVVCCLVLRNPIQLENCGHRLCKSCLDKMQEYAQRLNTDLICPNDREVIDMNRVFQDKGISRKVGNLRTCCRHPGCGCVVELRDLSKHEETCDFQVKPVEDPDNPGSSSDLMIEELLKRMQSCENNLAAKDKEIMQLTCSVKELREENITIREELNFVKEFRKDEDAPRDEANMAMKTWKLGDLEAMMKTAETKIAELESQRSQQKVDILERNVKSNLDNVEVAPAPSPTQITLSKSAKKRAKQRRNRAIKQQKEEQQPDPAALGTPGLEPLNVFMLATLSPSERKQMIGERLFPLVGEHQPLLAGKITGMLLEMDNSELLSLLESPDLLKAKVDEAVEVLQKHQASEVAAFKQAAVARQAAVHSVLYYTSL